MTTITRYSDGILLTPPATVRAQANHGKNLQATFSLANGVTWKFPSNGNFGAVINANGPSLWIPKVRLYENDTTVSNSLY